VRFTGDLPTRTGWYWVKMGREPPFILHVVVRDGGIRVHGRPLGDRVAAWAGPIEEPVKEVSYIGDRCG
jgi:hypothetical protein